MTAYKLTDPDGYTRRGQTGETLWAVGTTVHPTGVGSAPCGPGVLHAYVSAEVAVLANPAHARIAWPRCFDVEAAEWCTDGLKRWTTGPVTVLREVDLPALTLEERIAWAIVLAPHESTRMWAIGWLSGQDRSQAAARAAAEAARATVWEAWETREARAADAAAAARAAEAAAWETREAAADAAAAAWEARVVWAAAGAARAARAAAANPAVFEADLPRWLDRARAVTLAEWPAERAWEPLESPDRGVEK